MAEAPAYKETAVSRDQLADLLNEDLAREYQAIIAYVVYSQVLKGAEYMEIAKQLEEHAGQELSHALIISRQIDYLGKMPTVTAKPVRTSDDPREMLRFDLDNENDTVRNYTERVRQCEALGEVAMAEQIRQIIVQEQDHQIDLATALGEEVPSLSDKKTRASKPRVAYRSYVSDVRGAAGACSSRDCRYWMQPRRNCGHSGTTGIGSVFSGKSAQRAGWCQHSSCPELSRCLRMPSRSRRASAINCSRDISSRSVSMPPPCSTSFGERVSYEAPTFRTLGGSAKNSASARLIAMLRVAVIQAPAQASA